jgi:rhomboid protease GluP
MRLILEPGHDRRMTTMHGRPGTLTLALALIAIFIFEIARGAAGSEAALIPLGALRTRGWSALDWWRILTFSFLHLNWLHVLMNTAALLWLGGIVERRLGTEWFAGLFAAAAVSSGIAGMLLGPFLPTTGIAVGASGAVCGLLAAALILVFRMKPVQGEADRRLRMPLVIASIAAVAVSLVPGVSLAGHLGGFVGGALMVIIIA